MSSQLRVAVIGGGGDVARRDYLPEMRRLAGRARVELVCSRTADHAREAADKFDVDQWTTDWRDALGDDIDIVLNLTPAPLHGEVNLAVVQAGRHLYSEKPAAATREEGDAIASAAARSGSVVVAAPSVMVFPALVRAAEIMSSGLIGPVRSAHARASAGPPPWGGYESDLRPFFSAGVGPLSDLGVYPLHALTGLIGPVVDVAAASTRTRNSFVVTEGPFAGDEVPVGVDDNWQLALTMSDGALASLQSNFCTQGSAGPELELNGEEGAVAISLLDCSEPLRYFSETHGEWREERLEQHRPHGPDHLLGVQHLVTCVEEGTAPVLSLAHALHVVDVREAAATSTETGTRVSLTSSF